MELGEYRELRERIDNLNEVGVLEELRLFTMDGEDKNAEVCLVIYEELGTEDMIQMVSGVKKCCAEYGIAHPVIQVRYEGSVTEESES